MPVPRLQAPSTRQRPWVPGFVRACAGLLLLASANTGWAAELRLFTTAEQRSRLDAVRAEATSEELARAPEPEPAAPAKPEPPPEVHLRGFVRRSKGPSAVWVNGGSTLSGDQVGNGIDAGRIDGNAVVVTLPDGRRVRLKPGQSWDPEREKVVDVESR